MMRLPLRKQGGAAVAGLWMLALVGCAPAGDAPTGGDPAGDGMVVNDPAGDVLAAWDGGQVTSAELDALLRGLPEERRRPVSGQAVEDWIEERITDRVLPQVLLARARARGSQLADDPALELRARYLASQEIGRAYLHRRCPPEEVSEEDLAGAYAAAYPWQTRPWILVRHIYKAAPADAAAVERRAVRDAIEEVHRGFLAGASFVELARLHSDSETAADGGLIGRISRDAPMDPRVRDAAWALADGEVSGVVEVDNGYHLVQRVESGIEERPLLEAVRPELAEEIGRRRREECGGRVLGELGRATPIVFRQEGLAAADPRDDARTAVVLRIGDESFTLRQLDGLSERGDRLELTERPGQRVRHFAESVVLAAAARAEDEEARETYGQAEAAILDRLLIEAQRRAERRRQVESRPEEELRRYFEVHEERFRTDLELDVGMILVVADDRPGRQGALERARALHQRLLSGESFEALARAESAHSSRELAGRLGSLPVPRLRVVLGSQGIVRASRLAAGEVSEPVLIHQPPRAAYALLELYGRTEPQPRSFEEAREDLITALASDGVRQLDARVRERLVASAGLRFDQAAIAAYLGRVDG